MRHQGSGYQRIDGRGGQAELRSDLAAEVHGIQLGLAGGDLPDCVVDLVKVVAGLLKSLPDRLGVFRFVPRGEKNLHAVE